MPLTRDLADSVVVITGGSGGIGAATALRLARRGAAVVVGARRPGATAEVVSACRAEGGRALGVPVDVTEPAAVEALAQRAVEEFGRLDAWVNNASVAAYGTFTDQPIDEFRRVIETDLLGVAYGTRTAITHLRATGGGVIVNVSSVLGEVTVPYLSGYTTAKHGVRALSGAVRQELQLAGDREISVCVLLPASIGTPLYRNAANHTGVRVGPLPPVYAPEVVARRIVRLLEHPRREAHAGGVGALLARQWRLAPGLHERVMAVYADRTTFRGEPAAPTSGTVFAPADDPSAVDGGWHHRRWTAARLAALGVAGAGFALAGLRRARRS
ncbi:SDR family NAD(P)-dependent oxidoreductase [Phytohabitans houttuyneae]|uniref:Short-chain dehydrogenase n=1 Tax=Phytohabitans houttuyneae TaxID=1076126 RepID=A0A6V8K0W8_9ACTN|nr:SDR family NAD(P)-dependent oxidoreductase [Phytohabitans houttuyneae]GFJ76001.1 short-chain dehydrogenase [Phytohabitans houttuyneae]